MANPSISGRTALVTGAASGIGRAIARALAHEGASVGLLDRDLDALTQLQQEIASDGGRAAVTEADVSDRDSMDRAVDLVTTRLGPLRMAVNAAGIANAAPAEEMPRSQWETLYGVNVTGVFLSCQAEFLAMQEHQQGGAIVNIASMSGVIANRGLRQAHYNSAKAAVTQMSRSLAVEWATSGVRVNALSPGYTATPMNSRPEMADRMRQFADQVPMQRVAEPAEMAGPACFLLSDAASYVTGVDLLVDGGATAW